MRTIAQRPYLNKTDEELLSSLKGGGVCDDNAIYFLLIDKYSPKLRSVYNTVFSKHSDWYNDCTGELYLYMRGDETNRWDRLRSFEGRSSFGTWYGRVAYNKFNELKRQFIDKHIVDLDRFDAVGAVPEDIESRLQRVMLIEAISRLHNQDDKFIIIRRLYGYSSKEIAVMLQCRWDKHGIVKRDNLGNVVSVSNHYIDNRMSDIKFQLKRMLTVK